MNHITLRYTIFITYNACLLGTSTVRVCFEYLPVCGADSFKSPKYDCKFQHFAVKIRNMTATC